MPGINIASMHESLIFRAPVDDGVALELRITYLSHQGATLEIISPDELAAARLYIERKKRMKDLVESMRQTVADRSITEEDVQREIAASRAEKRQTS